MATIHCDLVDLKLSNIPLINARLDFNSLLALFRNETFRKQFLGFKGKTIPVKTHYFTWRGAPNELLTHFLREAIVGLESAVSGAVFTQSLRDNTLNSKEIRETTKDPLNIKGFRGTADCVFNGLPSLINPDFSLKQYNEALWNKLRKFYREIRNPLFHAYQVQSNDPVPVWKSLELLWEVYQWLNNWFPVEILLEGPINWAHDMPKRITEIQSIDDLRVKQIIPERSVPEEDKGYTPKQPIVRIEEVEGMYIPPEEVVDLGVRDENGNRLKIIMSPHAAMKLLVYLAQAHDYRKWQLPE